MNNNKTETRILCHITIFSVRDCTHIELSFLVGRQPVQKELFSVATRKC